MRLRDFTDPSFVYVGLHAADKASLLRELAARTAERLPGIDAEDLRQALEERERQGSTAVGQGIGIPHTFLEGLERTYCVLAQLPEGVDFGDTDEELVKFVFMLLSPPNARMDHIRLLARISRVANRDGFTRDALAATTPDSIHALIVNEDASHVD